MSWDQIINYPETGLKPTQFPQESEKRVIISKKSQPLPEYLTHYFDKEKFDFNIMFTEKPERSNNFLCQDKKVSRNAQKMRGIDRNDQIQEEAQEEQRSNQKSQSNWEATQQILKDIHLEQQQQQQQEEQKQKSKKESLWVDQKQIEAQDPKEEQKNQGSQIENFSEQFLNAKTMLLLSSQPKNEEELMHQVLEGQNQKIPLTANILEISQIRQKIDNREQDSEMQQMPETQRNIIKEQLQKQEFKSLKYHIKTENCEKIRLKKIIDPFGSTVKIKGLGPNGYLQIQNDKVTVTSYTHDNFIWKVGKSKRQIVPAMLSINCRSCRQPNKRCEIETINKFCSTICQNQTCTKNIIFEITQIVLQ